MNNFTSILNDVSVYGLYKYLGVSKDCDLDYYKSDVTIEWSVEIEARSWGIKSADISIQSVKTSLEWAAYIDVLSDNDKAILLAAGGTEYLNQTINGVIEIDTSSFGSEWEVKTDLDFHPDGSLCISDCDIEFDAVKPTINIS
ncbi:MAG TPA: hypothetical protein PLN38_14690 [Chitinophagales bacterium]|nr:hypothetical protein [Chitinophagales bacterium]